MRATLSSLTLSLCLFSIGLFADNNIIDKATSESFPANVSFVYNGQHYELQGTGVGTRKKFLVNVYSVAHYLQTSEDSSSDKVEQILQDKLAKQLTLKWVRDVEAAKVQEGFQESFKQSLSPSDYSKLQNEIGQFQQFFSQNVKKGDVDVIRWVPGGHVQVVVNSKVVGEITNKDFAVGLWNIWFGNKGIVDRSQLISLIK